MVERFRTRPVEVEAVQFKRTLEGYRYLQEWTDGNFRLRYESAQQVEVAPTVFVNGPDTVVFEVFDKLHDTWIKVFPGQWIVRGTKGEFYPCDDETFQWKYESADAPEELRCDFDCTVCAEGEDDEEWGLKSLLGEE